MALAAIPVTLMIVSPCAFSEVDAQGPRAALGWRVPGGHVVSARAGDGEKLVTARLALIRQVRCREESRACPLGPRP